MNDPHKKIKRGSKRTSRFLLFIAPAEDNQGPHDLIFSYGAYKERALQACVNRNKGFGVPYILEVAFDPASGKMKLSTKPYKRK